MVPSKTKPPSLFIFPFSFTFHYMYIYLHNTALGLLYHPLRSSIRLRRQVWSRWGFSRPTFLVSRHRLPLYCHFQHKGSHSSLHPTVAGKLLLSTVNGAWHPIRPLTSMWGKAWSSCSRAHVVHVASYAYLSMSLASRLALVTGEVP